MQTLHTIIYVVLPLIVLSLILVDAYRLLIKNQPFSKANSVWYIVVTITWVVESIMDYFNR